jgi:hypothetical protein
LKEKVGRIAVKFLHHRASAMAANPEAAIIALFVNDPLIT